MEFTTRFGVIAASVGSAVGLGNIWRFPYEAGEHGGGAFLLIYCLFILIIGLPVITAEFIIGRSSRSNVYGAFKHTTGKRSVWRSFGLFALLGAAMILGFYSVVAGWTGHYVVSSLCNFNGASTTDELHTDFGNFIASWEAVGWTLAFILVNFLIMRRGVQKGIEKMSNMFMPLLFVILLVFCVHSLMMSGASQGLEFLFKPDFSEITPQVMLGAMGQAFFSLSIGLGCMLTYASYFSNNTKLLNSAGIIAGLDTLVAVLAGIIIFPAVFSFGASPAEGPALVFEVLPSIFLDMEWGMLWSVLFFVLLLLASLTSTISLNEIIIAYLTDEKKMGRTKATAITTGVIAVLAVGCSLSFGPLSGYTLCGKTIFDLCNFCSSNLIMPLGGILFSIYVGWHMKRGAVNAQLRGTSRVFVAMLIFCLRYVAPICIAVVFLSGLGLLN